MKLRRYIYYFAVFTLPASAAILNNDNTTTPFSMRAIYRPHHTLTSGPKSYITHQQLATAGFTSLAQALQSLGGIQLQESNGSQISLSMRGFGSNATSNTLFLVNGIPITNPDLAPPDLNVIPLHEIEYIEIIAGSESVLYGDQAVGGIINVVTRQYANDIAELSISGGSYNQFNVYAAFHQHINQCKLNTTLFNEYTDNYRNNNNYAQTAVLGNISLPYVTGKLNVDYKFAHENLRYPGALTAHQVSENRRQSKNDTDYFKDWSYFLLLQQQQKLNSDWILDTAFSRRDMNGNGVLTSPFTQTRITHYLRPLLKGKWCNTLIISGVDFQDDRYRLGSVFGITKDKQQKYGFFSVAKIMATHCLFISIGARGAQQNIYLRSFGVNNNINRAFASTIGGTYQLTHDISYYLRRAESFRFPKADENAFRPPGVTALRTQHGVAYETGMHLNRDDYSAKIGLYELRLRDEITYDPLQTPETPFGSNRNLSPTIRHGATLSGKYNITQTFNIDAQYNYVNARFQNGIHDGNRIPLVSENIVRSGIDYRFKENWSVYTEAIFTGSQYAANDDANHRGKVGGYTIYNFNLRYAFKCMNAALRVNNLFNKQYYFYTVFQPGAHQDFFYPAPERNFTLTLNINFA